MSSTTAKLRRAAEDDARYMAGIERRADETWTDEAIASLGITQMRPLPDALERFTTTKARAEMAGFVTAHEYLAYRTKLRADYAAAFARKAHQPATYLPIMHAFRSTVPTAEVEA